MNNLRYQNKTPTKYYYGATEVPSIYYGGTQVYSAQPYKELEYIESTGTQYIDVGVKSNEVYGFEFKMFPISFNTNYSAFVGATYDNYNVSFLTSLNSSFMRIRNIELTDLSLNLNSPTIWSYIGKEVKQIVNNKVTWSRTISAGTLGTTSANINLFRCSAGNNTNKTTIRIYYYKLYDNNGTLIRDLVPCDYKGAIGLWDKVNNQFYGNAGTGNFITVYPPEPYTQLDYIDFTPTTYINTKIYPNLNVRETEILITLNFSLNNTGNQLLYTTESAGYSNTLRARIDDTVLRTVYGRNSSTATVGALELNRTYTFDFIRYDRTSIISKLDNVTISTEILQCDSNSTPLLLGQGNFRCYSYKITINGKLMRNFIPVIRTSDSKPYMLDKVHNQFYPILSTQLDPSTDSGGSGR